MGLIKSLKQHWKQKKIPLCWIFRLFNVRVPERLEWIIGQTVVPTAITQPATNITTSAARLNGKIGDDGGADAEARFRYRKTDTKKLQGATGFFSGTNGEYNPDGTHDGQTRWKHKTENYWILYDGGLGLTHVGNKRNFTDEGFIEIYSRLGTSVDGSYFNTNGTGDVSVADTDWTTTDWQGGTLKTDDTYYLDVSSLDSGTEYEFQTQAKNSAGEGDWTASATFYTITQINYLQDLDAVRDRLGDGYILMRDLDFNDDDSYDQTDPDWETKKTAWTTGTGWTPIGTFTGIFDGQNYSISNLFIDDSMLWGGGLFGLVKNGEIKNTKLDNVNITASGGTGTICRQLDPGTLTNIHTNGNITVSNSYTGGMVGDTYGSTISNCSANVNIITGTTQIGGFIGIPNTTTITNCYAKGNVAGTSKVGGFVGNTGNNDTIENCYSTGSVTRLSGVDTDIAGFCGFNYQGSITKCYSTGSVHYTGTDDPTDKGFVGMQNTDGDYEDADNFFDKETSGQLTTTGNATAKTTAEMKDILNYTDTETVGLTEAWDMTSYEDYKGTIWFIKSSEYPQLKFEYVSPYKYTAKFGIGDTKAIINGSNNKLIIK